MAVHTVNGAQKIETADQQSLTPRHGSIEPSEHQDLVFETPPSQSMRHYREQSEGFQFNLTGVASIQRWTML